MIGIFSYRKDKQQIFESILIEILPYSKEKFLPNFKIHKIAHSIPY